MSLTTSLEDRIGELNQKLEKLEIENKLLLEHNIRLEASRDAWKEAFELVAPGRKNVRIGNVHGQE